MIIFYNFPTPNYKANKVNAIKGIILGLSTFNGDENCNNFIIWN